MVCKLLFERLLSHLLGGKIFVLNIFSLRLRIGIMKTIIIIPARMHSTRLPCKPLADIAGVPMVVRVWQRALEAGIGDVLVATDHEDIARVIKEVGGQVAMTDPELPSGTDRVWQALNCLPDNADYNTIVNVQGDLAILPSYLIAQSVEPLKEGFDIGTLAVRIEEEDTKPSSVKIAWASTDNENIHRALYFSRSSIPNDADYWLHHIGIYAFKRGALKRFVELPEAQLEKWEKLEQLRALVNGMSIGVRLTDRMPASVDTPADLEMVRALISN
jgi:3-deoxy-manno-octulosonate cytidylyltransferase (CMP-KDO synthetase)